mmetsp:Transcript_3885/g.11227  ORF Transcript_3885/g.11227 Transcript_3885/m.11227 type:complete len:193 (-) Transcript_3885:2965-3543(-)
MANAMVKDTESSERRRRRRSSDTRSSRRTSKDNTPPRGSLLLQSKMLKEVKDFDKTSLVPCSSASPSPRRSSLGSGKGSPLSNYDEGEGLRRRSFELKALKDDQVAKVLDGVFVGGIGGAKNKEELDKNGVTHVVNCSPGKSEASRRPARAGWTARECQSQRRPRCSAHRRRRSRYLSRYPSRYLSWSRNLS